MYDNKKENMENKKNILNENKSKKPINKVTELVAIYLVIAIVTSRVYSSYQRATDSINLEKYFIVLGVSFVISTVICILYTTIKKRIKYKGK